MQQLIAACVESVQAEIAAATSGGGSERSIRVINGRFQRTADERHVYVFNIAREMPSSYDDAPVRLLVAGVEISGSIVGFGEFEITLALDDYLGQYISEAELVIDLTFILKRLKEMLEDRASLLQSNPISRKAMNLEKAQIGERQPTPPKNDCKSLNAAQSIGLRKCLGSDFLMVWGPPGTGKTHVLAHLLREEVLAGRPILLMSNTNIAVDQALSNFLELCDTDDRVRALFEQGKFVRLGTPQIDDVESLMLDRVVEKLNADIQAVLDDRRSRLESLLHDLGEIQASIARFRQLIHLKTLVRELENSYKVVNGQLSQASEESDQVSAELRKARESLMGLREKRGLAAMLAKLSEPTLQSRAKALTSRSADLSIRMQKLSNEKIRTEQEWKSAEISYSKLSANAEPTTLWDSRLSALETSERKQSAEIESVTAEVAELESRMSGVRDQVVQDALLVACTCAKSTLDKAVSSRQFDTVVTDESSMISLPQALWCSSLAKGRFLCFGDFRQLPPISMIDEKADPAHREIMCSSVFERNNIGISGPLHISQLAIFGQDEADFRPLSLEDTRLHMLNEQYRMPDQICQLVSGPMYEGKLKTHPDVRSVDNPFTLISTSDFNAWSDKTEGFSWFNWHHAFVVVELVRQLLSEETLLAGEEILVLAPYRAQVEIIRTLLKEASSCEGALEEVVSVSTVWRSQGRERAVVILDTVCAPPFTRPGRWFLDEPGPADGARLLNVAVTRSKGRLYLVAHTDYLKRVCPPNSLAATILRAFEKDSSAIDSRRLTDKSLPAENERDAIAGVPVLTFPSGTSAIFNEDGFLRSFADDLDSMPTGSTITIFSPFLNERSVAHWGPRFRSVIERGCRLEIFTRRPARMTALFLTPAEVEYLIEELRSLGAAVGYYSYVPGKKSMHYKIAILRFPGDSEAPIVWKGSMNALGHYSSEEIMDRTQSKELCDCLAGLLKLGQMQTALVGKSLADEIEAFLRDDLDAICPTHKLPMCLKYPKKARWKSYFMSCPSWKKTGCQVTINVDVDEMNKALAAVDARCLQDDCDERVEARNGRAGVYLKCSDDHFVNLAL